MTTDKSPVRRLMYLAPGPFNRVFYDVGYLYVTADEEDGDPVLFVHKWYPWMKGRERHDCERGSTPERAC